MNKLPELDQSQLDAIQTVVELRESVWSDWPLIYQVLLGHTVKPCHERWVNFQLNNPWTILLGPRLYGKTQVCVKDYAILKSLRNVDSRDDRILILGKTMKQARGILREVRFQLEQNQLVNIFGRFFDSSVERTEKTQTDLFFCNRTKIFSEPNISALGIGGSNVSRHFSMILADDLVDQDNAVGIKSDQTFAWIKEEIMPMLLPGGEFHIIGSSWSSKDPYHRMIKEAQNNKFAFKIMIDTALDAKGESIWPEWISTAELDAMRERMTEPYFLAQMMQDVTLLERERKLFFIEDVKFQRRSEIIRKTKRIVIGIDPASGEGDSWTTITAIADIEETPDLPKYWIIEQFKEKIGSAETKEILKNLLSIYADHSIETMRIEATSGFIDFANTLARELPIEKRTPVGSKISRFNQVSILFRNGAIGCVEECRDLMSDFWDYPDGESNDLIDSFEIAFSAIATQQEEGDYFFIDFEEKRDRLGRLTS